MNPKGEIIIPSKFEDAREFSEVLAVVRINGKDGY
ncbi:MAG: WG repeat-containing protein, partial [Ignavibacteria bacterium]